MLFRSCAPPGAQHSASLRAITARQLQALVRQPRLPLAPACVVKDPGSLCSSQILNPQSIWGDFEVRRLAHGTRREERDSKPRPSNREGIHDVVESIGIAVPDELPIDPCFGIGPLVERDFGSPQEEQAVAW